MCEKRIFENFIFSTCVYDGSLSQKIDLFICTEELSYFFCSLVKKDTHNFAQQTQCLTHCSVKIIEFCSLDHPVNLTYLLNSGGAILSKTIGNEPWIEHRLTFKKIFFSLKKSPGMCSMSCWLYYRSKTSDKSKLISAKILKIFKDYGTLSSKIFVMFPIL